MSVADIVTRRVGLGTIGALRAERGQDSNGQTTFNPRSAAEIQEIIRYANRNRMPVFTRSSSTRKGGSSSHVGGGILIDLSHMNSIINVDMRNRAVRLEPGVTWGQLAGELRTHKLKASNPLLPRAEKSALSSFLDREPMLVPRFEYGEPILTMEVVLPNGTIFRTGSASGPPVFKRTNADMVGPYGPATMDFFRLFQGSRGTLGVVTWINIKVEHLPEMRKLFFLRCRDSAEMVKPLYEIARRMIGHEILALNDQSLASILTEDRAERFAELKASLSPWTIVISIAGGPRLPRRKLEYEEEALRATAQELGMELCEDPGVQPQDLVPKLEGPWEDGTYWRDGLRGASFDIYFLTHLNKACECAASFRALAEKHGFDPRDIAGYVQPLENGRACHMEFSVPLEPGKLEGRETGSLCRETVVEITGQGGYFSRVRRPWAEQVYKQSPSYTAAMRKMKDILDPNHILNPGES